MHSTPSIYKIVNALHIHTNTLSVQIMCSFIVFQPVSTNTFIPNGGGKSQNKNNLSNDTI